MQTPMMSPALMQPVQMDGFQKAWEAGMQKRREDEARRAMAALVGNPNDPQAQEAAAMHNPQMVVQLKQQQAQAAMQQVEQHRDQIKIGAQIIRQIKPRDQASWDQALAVAQQYGINPDQIGVPRQFDPSYVQNIVGLADALAPQSQGQDPSFIREADMLGVPRDRARELWEQKQGIVVINGVPHMSRPSSGPQPGQVEDGYRFKGGNPADPNSWEPVGGQTVAPSGPFQP